MTKLYNIFLHVLMGVFGGLTYMGIELLWRCHTHWSMGVIGGLCFVLIGLLDELQDHPPMLLQMIQGMCIVTAIELVSGVVLNIILGLGIWDYSNMPGNILGQVCPQFMAAWFFLSAAAVKIENLLHKIFD